jgi:hypothetical protein
MIFDLEPACPHAVPPGALPRLDNAAGLAFLVRRA